MILSNLIGRLSSYIGLDPEWSATTFVNRASGKVPELAVEVGTATDAAQLNGSDLANLVVINSTTQYFPSREYLLHVVEYLVNLENVERIFFGDVRSYALYKDFLAAKGFVSPEGQQQEMKSR